MKLWQWHAIEEIEHKSVAYDTFVAATRNMPALKRWLIRTHVMALISVQFWHSITKHMADFFSQDGINTLRTWLRVLIFLLVSPGMWRKIFIPYVSFYLPGFHPWRHDDRALILRIERQLAADSPV